MTAETSPLVRKADGYSKPFVATAAVAAFLLGAVVALSHPSSFPTVSSSLAALLPDPRWNCEGSAKPIIYPPKIEDAPFDISVKLKDSKGDTTMSPDKYYRVKMAEDIQIVVEAGSADIYGFFFDHGLNDGSTPQNPGVVNTDNSVQLKEVANKTCGDSNGGYSPVVNGVTGSEENDVPIKGVIAASYTSPSNKDWVPAKKYLGGDNFEHVSCEDAISEGAGACIEVTLIAGPDKKLYKSYYAVGTGKSNSSKKKKKGDSASRALVHVATVVVGVLAALAMMG